MSQSINSYLILDDRLNIKDNINFGIVKSAQSINQQTFTAQTLTPTNITVNCQIPSLMTVIDRRVQVRSRLEFTITGTTVDNTRLVNYPVDTCLANFPFSQCVNTLSISINNTTVNANYADTLNLMLRQMSEKDLAKYSDLTPTQLDFYKSTATAGSLSPFLDIASAYLSDVLPRGAWELLSIEDNDQAAAAHAVKIVVEVTEPIFCSPFLFGDGLDNHASGLSGVSAINFNFNMSSNVNRALRMKAGTRTGLSCVLSSVLKCDVLMTFLSPKPSTQIPLTCSLPYMEMPVYKTTTQAIVGATASFQVNSAIVSPNAIPDRVILAVRKQVNTQAITDNEYYYPISNVNITWGTSSGVLASCSLQDLYHYSKKNGLNMKYPQFVGRASLGQAGAAVSTTALSGGLCILDFNEVIPIIEEYYTSSSLGNWTFSVQVTCQNAYDDLAVGVPATELLVCFVNSGVFQSTSGSSSQFVGLVSKQECLKVSQEEPVVSSENRRLIGAGFWSSMKSALPSLSTIVKGVAPLAKNYLKGSDSKAAQGAASALGALGYGKPRHY